MHLLIMFGSKHMFKINTYTHIYKHLCTTTLIFDNVYIDGNNLIMCLIFSVGDRTMMKPQCDSIIRTLTASIVSKVYRRTENVGVNRRLPLSTRPPNSQTF